MFIRLDITNSLMEARKKKHLQILTNITEKDISQLTSIHLKKKGLEIYIIRPTTAQY